MRIAFGAGYRVYVAQDGKTVVVLLCGGDKSSQKADIKRAKALWAHYRRLTRNGGSREVFLLALRQVAEAHSMSRIAAQADLGRETLYRTLSRRGNPRLDTLIRLLSAAGLRLSVETAGSPMKARRRRVA